MFVLVGPFNKHMLNDADGAAYNAIKTGVSEWLKKNEIPHLSCTQPCQPSSTSMPAIPSPKATPCGPDRSSKTLPSPPW